MKYLALIVAFLVTTSVYASPRIDINHHNNSVKGVVKSNNYNGNKNANYNGNKNSSYNKNSNYSKSKSNSNAYSHSSNKTKVDVDASSRSKSKSKANSTAYTGDNEVYVEGDDSYSVYKEVRQAPMVIPGSGNNTAQCIKVIGLGGSYAAGNAGGFSLGWPKTDWECSLDRAAKMAFSLGNVTTGWKLFCSQKTTVRAYRGLNKKLTKVGAVEACLYDSK